jgi:phage-related protein
VGEVTRRLGNLPASYTYLYIPPCPIRPCVGWGASLEDLSAFPEVARREPGYQLRRVQQGLLPDDWKPMPTVGPGVYEIRIHSTVEHRIFYIAKFSEAVYVLHAFEKRTRQTRQADIDLARKRLADVTESRRGR